MEIAPCPFLPVPQQSLTAACLGNLIEQRGPEFYHMTLLYGQSLWLQGFPARALLQLNHSLSCGLIGTEEELRLWPLPYKALAWILRHHGPGQFIGNPRRHWQHLATRMVEPYRELRTWRAWACWRLACLLLPDMPADELQLARENIAEPSEAEIATRLTSLGLPGETAVWRDALAFSRCCMETEKAPC